MSGKIGKQIPNLPSTTGAAGFGASSGSAAPSGSSVRPDDGPLMLVPAGFVSNILGGLSKTVTEITGGYFGRTPLSQRIATTVPTFPPRLLPFQIIEPALTPQSAGPDGGSRQGNEALVVVPAGFLGGVLGGIGGNLLGGVVGKWLGNESAGKTAGSILGKIGGGLLPFSVVPPSVVAQSAGPDAAAAQEPMVLVPAGFFGNLLSGISGTVGGLIGGDTGRKIGDAASPLLRLVPFQEVPQDLAPQSAGPDTPDEDRLIVVPAGFLGNLLSGLSGTIGAAVGGAFGNARTGRAIGEAARPVLDMIPFHAAPPDLLPQSDPATTGTATGSEEQMMLVPAGLFGSLLSGLAGTLGGVAGKAFGRPELGRAIGEGLSPIAKLIPFQTIDPEPAHTS